MKGVLFMISGSIIFSMHQIINNVELNLINISLFIIISSSLILGGVFLEKEK